MFEAHLIAASILWFPSDGADMIERELIAEAIVSVTSDDFERALLMVVATEESLFDRRIRTCVKKGDHGRSLGPWQTYAASPKQRAAICSDVVAAARRALALLRESESNCRHQPAKWRHAAYASGSCTSKVGRAIAERRFNRATDAVRAARERS